jgi:hypothetical protein
MIRAIGHLRLLRLTALAVLVTTPAAAQDAPPPELVTDRPDQTESSNIVPFGWFQLETGLAHEKAGDVSGESIADTLVRIGVGRGFELRLGLSGYQSIELPSGPENKGLGDSSIGFKLALAEERGARPEIALLVGTTLPTGSSDLTSDRADPSFRFTLANTLTERLFLGTNAGIAWRTEPDATGHVDTLSVFEWTAALGFGATDVLGFFVELFGESGLSAEGSDALFDGGVTYLIRPNVQFDVAAGVDLSDSSIWFAGAGISFRLPH